MRLLYSNEWIEFLEKIRVAQEELDNPTEVWFRGQQRHDYYLLPSLLRFNEGLEKEQEMFHKFRRFAERIFKNKASEWETLFDMQHYGIPTRLLDWTETFGIALYFATYSQRDVDSAIYLLDPKKLNKKSGKESVIRLPHEEKDFSYSGVYWERKPFKANAPIAIEPIFNNDRMIAQRAMFTVHNDDTAPIEDMFPDAIKKVILPTDAIPSALEFLKVSNINEYSVYPDLAGIARYLRNSFNLTWGL